jgi:ribosomal protein S27E
MAFRRTCTRLSRMNSAATTASHAFPVSCLECGHVRIVRRTPTTNLDTPVCPACSYVGWREAGTLDVARSFEQGFRELLPRSALLVARSS